jgi:DNA-directed RNA polymerase subunit RPC12/RpoP
MKKLLNLLILTLFVSKVLAQKGIDCVTCSSKLITKELITDLSIDEIRLLTNEIYARNGFVFENSRFQEYFSEKSWYKRIKNNKTIQLNEVEKKNIDFFQERTKQLKTLRANSIDQLKQLQKLVLKNDIVNLKNQFGYKPETGSYSDLESFKLVFSKINLDDINWYKNTGIHKILVDNGFVIIEYSIKIEGKSVNLIYNFMSNSEIMGGFDEFTDYHSENEHVYNWQFEFVNNKIKFVKLAIAG